MTPEPLTAAQRERLAGLLAEERVRTAGQLHALTRTFRELVDAADLEPPDDEHDPDGTTAYERAQVTSLLEETRLSLLAMDAAQERLTNGSYGVCEMCSRPVGVERLGALPAATRCIVCASR